MTLQPYEDISSIQLLLHNIELLGFDPRHDITTVHAYEKIVFDATLFTHHHIENTNQRAFECISYFLFRQMDAIQTDVTFASCWPIHENSASRNYRTTAYHWLLDLQHQRLISLTLRRNDFDTCQGDAFIDTMLAFSTLVLQTVIDRDLADPRGRPIRLIPSYHSHPSSAQAKRARPTILMGDTEEIEKQLQDAIRSLAHYTDQQKVDFTALVKKAQGKITTWEKQLNSERSAPVSALGEQYTPPNLSKIRERIATLRTHQQRKLEILRMKQQHEQIDRISQRQWTPIEETVIKNLDEFEEMQTLLLNDDSSWDESRATQDNQHTFTLPSLLTPLDSDPTKAIQRIQELVKHHIHENHKT